MSEIKLNFLIHILLLFFIIIIIIIENGKWAV